MKEMICIVCPRGCHLSVGDAPEYIVTGNGCARGAVYGHDEATSPRRVVTATCPIDYASRAESGAEKTDAASGAFLPRRVPVRTTGGIPKDRVGALVALLMATRVSVPVRLGDVIIENWEGLDVSVVATRTIA